jgi:DNA-binding protein HU-beta
MRKQDLVRAVAQETKLTEAQASAAVNAVIDTIQNSLAQGEEVNISGFGAFRVVERAARDGRNPRSGEPMKIGPRKSAAFRAGTQLKRAVENGAA